jgi:hypothetical protein
MENQAGQPVNDGYHFVITVIQFLENTFNIHFFITPKDFDVLYRWYEKRIPIPVIKNAISAVVERWAEKNKKITGFSNFYYQVKKDFETFLQLQVGAENQNNEEEFLPYHVNEYEVWENFFKDFPPTLSILKEDLELLFQHMKNKEKVEPMEFYEKLVALFKDDETLNLKVAIFNRNLAPELRRPEIENRYRLNFLLNKYKIPDFE